MAGAFRMAVRRGVPSPRDNTKGFPFAGRPPLQPPLRGAWGHPPFASSRREVANCSPASMIREDLPFAGRPPLQLPLRGAWGYPSFASSRREATNCSPASMTGGLSFCRLCSHPAALQSSRPQRFMLQLISVKPDRLNQRHAPILTGPIPGKPHNALQESLSFPCPLGGRTVSRLPVIAFLLDASPGWVKLFPGQVTAIS